MGYTSFKSIVCIENGIGEFIDWCKSEYLQNNAAEYYEFKT